MRILLESSTESEWVATCLEELGHEAVVADPNYAAMYGTRTRRIKTDRRDVAALAEGNRTGIYRPAARVSPAQRAIRQRLLVRSSSICCGRRCARPGSVWRPARLKRLAGGSRRSNCPRRCRTRCVR